MSAKPPEDAVPAVVRFVRDLRENGCVRVPPPPAEGGSGLSGPEQSQLRDECVAFDQHMRSELVDPVPELSLPVARWACTLLYRACQCLAHREMGAKQVAEAFARPCPEPVSASTIYSADLFFRFLPDLVRLAEAAAPGDVLGQVAREHLASWPLSAVGVANSSEQSAKGDSQAGTDAAPALEAPLPDANSKTRGAAFLIIEAQPSLLASYVDRVIDSGDPSWIVSEPIRKAVAIALGAHPELCPTLQERVFGNPAD